MENANAETAPSDRVNSRVRPAASFISLWVLLTFIWFAMNSSLALESIATGSVLSAALAFIFVRTTNVWQDFCFSPIRIYHFVRYTCVFAIELVRSNINMMRYVYSPRINIKPGVVKITTRLKSPLGRLALANSIALTPGSLVVDMAGDTMYVHWLDVQTTDPEEAARILAGPFEKHLEKAFG